MKLFEKNNILIARFSSIGDVLLTSPIVRALRKKFPNSNIDYITTSQMRDIIRFNPNINHVWTFDKSDSKEDIRRLKSEILNKINANKYDVLVDLQNNLRSNLMLRGIAAKSFGVNKNRFFKLMLVHTKKKIKQASHVVDRYFDCASELGIMPDDYGLEIFGETGEKIQRVHSDGATVKIGIAAGAQHFTKRWLPEHFTQLAELIANKFEAEFQFFGSLPEQGTVRQITEKLNCKFEDYTGKLSLLESARKISECDFFITNDTGLMHIAAACQVPIISIFGSTVPEFGFYPYKANHRIAQIELNCRPCTHIGRESCPKGHFNCMKQLAPEIVLGEFMKLKGD